MKKKIIDYSRFFVQSAWYYTRPILAFDNFKDWRTIVSGVVIANFVGVFLLNEGKLAFTLVNVGSFLGTILCVVPRHNPILINSIKGTLLVAIGTSLGIVLQQNTFLVILLFCLGLYVSGIARNFSIGMYIRWLFFAISIVAGSEMSGSFPIDKVWLSLGAVIIGMSIVSLIVGVFSKHKNDSLTLITQLYKELYVLAQGKDSRYSHMRTMVRESIEVMPRLMHIKMSWIYELITQADLIAGSLRWRSSEENILALKLLVSRLQGEDSSQSIEISEVNTEIRGAFDILQSEYSSKKILLSGLFPTKEGLEELKDIMLSYKGSSSRFAIRLVLTGLVCHMSSKLFNYIYPMPLDNHEFWVALSGCLMVMPGYHGTIGKITSRTFGSIIGAFMGMLLFLAIPNIDGTYNIWHILVSCLLVIVYETTRKMSQALLMSSVTLWLTFTLGGSPAGLTRMFDVIFGALIAFVVFFIFPTWHDRVLIKNISAWCSVVNSITEDVLTKEDYHQKKKNRWRNIYRIQGRINKSIQEIVLEYPVYNSKLKVGTLLAIQNIMEDIILDLVQILYNVDSKSNIPAFPTSSERSIYKSKIDLLSIYLDEIVSDSLKEGEDFAYIQHTLKVLEELE